jgi:predicted membrane protein
MSSRSRSFRIAAFFIVALVAAAILLIVITEYTGVLLLGLQKEAEQEALRHHARSINFGDVLGHWYVLAWELVVAALPLALLIKMCKLFVKEVRANKLELEKPTNETEIVVCDRPDIWPPAPK